MFMYKRPSLRPATHKTQQRLFVLLQQVIVSQMESLIWLFPYKINVCAAPWSLLKHKLTQRGSKKVMRTTYNNSHYWTWAAYNKRINKLRMKNDEYKGKQTSKERYKNAKRIKINGWLVNIVNVWCVSVYPAFTFFSRHIVRGVCNLWVLFNNLTNSWLLIKDSRLLLSFYFPPHLLVLAPLNKII